ncbi:MAG TPA: hypothetical protein VG253_06670 [Streptosporangiaceae bacterium]|jgi:hypothetical protein|nr:hypothetical protein [Streptosporangiaceae bacterium]
MIPAASPPRRDPVIEPHTGAREKITVLNLRHSLSTAIAARAAGFARWQAGLNVNRLLAGELGSELGWIADPVFTALLGGPGAA